MAVERDNGTMSDTEGGERPVREQLQKAHITSQPAAVTPDALPAEATTKSSSSSNEEGPVVPDAPRGRLHRKRSHEEVDADLQGIISDPLKVHNRKRSRDSTLEEIQLNNGQRKVSGERTRNGDETTDAHMSSEEAVGIVEPPRAVTPEASSGKGGKAVAEALASPKTKRSRLHSATTEGTASRPNSEEISPVGQSAEARQLAEEAVSDAKPSFGVGAKAETDTKVPSTSGFANTSMVSPFGSLAGSKSPSAEPQTSASAFASSGFSGLTGSTSGFGTIPRTTGAFGLGAGFASGKKSIAENETSRSPPSSFGGAMGQESVFTTTSSAGSPFTSSASGFGTLRSTGGFGGGVGGTGFGSLAGGGLTSFASGKPAAPLGLGSSKPTRAFGAAPDDEENEEADDDDKVGAKSPLATEEEKQDERFYEQELETGEEDEVTEFSARAKLYNFAAVPDGKKEWRERGLGVLRFNVKTSPDQGQKPKARLLMRAEGSHRVVLNTPVTRDIKFGAPTGGPPQGGYLYFMGTTDGREGLELLQLKMKQANALDLHNHITNLQEEM